MAKKSSAKSTLVKKDSKKSAPKAAPAKTKAEVKKVAVKAKPAPKVQKASAAKPVAKVAPAKVVAAVKAKPSAKEMKKAEVKEVKTAKPAMMTAKGKASVEAKVVKSVNDDAPKSVKKVKEPQDQGDMLLEKAREEMSGLNGYSAEAKAEKANKIKPIKIERGNSADEKAKWLELNKRYGKEKAVAYKMTDSFEPLKPIQHKVLGWGFILTNENNRLEVLFENGIKMLISNYKPS